MQSNTSSSSAKPAVKRTYGSKSNSTTAARPSTSSLELSPPSKHRRLTTPPSATPPLASSSGTSSEQSDATTISDLPCEDEAPLLLSSSPVQQSTRKAVNKIALPGRRQATASKQTTKPDQLDVKGKGRLQKKSTVLEQMHLNISTSPLATTCSKCEMSYVRGAIEDEDLHRRYCKKVSSGIDWPAGCSSNASVQVVQDGIWLGKGKDALEGSIVMIEGRAASGALLRKLEEVATIVNQSLSAAALSEEDARASTYILFLAQSSSTSVVTTSRRVIGCAIVSRIRQAYRAMRSCEVVDTSLLRFGEDEGAIFCSPTPVPALLGVHRIWCSPSHRRLGTARRLLDAAADRAIYGCPVLEEERRDKFAFSQPSSAGQRLFTAWTGTASLLIFVD